MSRLHELLLPHQLFDKLFLFCQDGNAGARGDGADLPHGDRARVGFCLEICGFCLRDGNQQPAAGLGVVKQGLEIDRKLAFNSNLGAKVKLVV